MLRYPTRVPIRSTYEAVVRCITHLVQSAQIAACSNSTSNTTLNSHSLSLLQSLYANCSVQLFVSRHQQNPCESASVFTCGLTYVRCAAHACMLQQQHHQEECQHSCKQYSTKSPRQPSCLAALPQAHVSSPRCHGPVRTQLIHNPTTHFPSESPKCHVSCMCDRTYISVLQHQGLVEGCGNCVDQR